MELYKITQTTTVHDEMLDGGTEVTSFWYFGERSKIRAAYRKYVRGLDCTLHNDGRVESLTTYEPSPNEMTEIYRHVFDEYGRYIPPTERQLTRNQK